MNGSASGLQKLLISDRRAQRGEIGFKAVAKEATLATPVGPLRGTIVLAADIEAGALAAECGVHTFPAIACTATGATVRCRQ